MVVVTEHNHPNSGRDHSNSDRHLFPTLAAPAQPSFFFGHIVDHVGQRVNTDQSLVDDTLVLVRRYQHMNHTGDDSSGDMVQIMHEQHRRVAQINLVPSIVILLRLPIPFDSFASIIPDLFPGSHLQHTYDIGNAQIKVYLRTYRASGTSIDLDIA
ncbi:hypothetical protein GGG16DRAFT_117659 [Schizophyllum commune]